MRNAALACQVVLLAYHQVTTLFDLHPFNGVRRASRAERFTEAGVNAILMSLAPLGFALGVRPLMLYGVIYYFVLFFFELVIWWIPYFSAPSGRWLRAYNFLLSVATTSFGERDPLASWTDRHVRLHSATITLLRHGRGPIVPNLEHMILHAWTAVTATATLAAFLAWPG
jgi:hypothetical protein